MKNLLFSSILALAMLSLAGCYGASSCNSSAIKTTKAAKCGANSKCGDAKKATPMKCGAGKCGSAK